MEKTHSAREKLFKAFYALIKQKPREKISITELVKTAGVNRSTFYRNFTNTEELYAVLCNEALEKIFSRHPETVDLKHIVSSCLRITNILAEYKEIITVLSPNIYDKYFLLKLRNRFAAAIREKAVGSADEEYSEFLADALADYIFLSLILVITEDFYREMPSPDTELSYDMEKNPADSVSEAMRQLYGGSFEAQYSFLCSFVRAVSDGNMMEMNLRDILKPSGYCHSNFYRTFKNKTDYMVKIVSVLASLMEGLLLPLLCQDDSAACRPVLDHWEEACAEVGCKALHQAFDCGYCYDISALVMRSLFDSYLSALFADAGREPGAEERVSVSLYVFAFSCTLSHFFYTNDRETVEKNLRHVFRLKKDLIQKAD